ncbi:MAG: transposase family protein [Bacteroidetes bacterium]|nr:transposase family protein [Bacteroidota bacterium]
MNLTFREFAEQRNTTYDTIQKNAYRSGWKEIRFHGKKYPLIQSGIHEINGKKRYLVVVPEEEKKKKHLTLEERKNAYTELMQVISTGVSESEAIGSVAKKYRISYWSVYRMLKEPQRIERRRRADANCSRKDLPQEVIDYFDSIYIQNAQRGNARLAFNLTRQKYNKLELPYRFFLKRGKQLENIRLAYHQQAQYEKRYTPRLRRDLWTEYEFMEQVSLDGWTVPDRVLQSWGLGELTNKKFKYNNRDVSFVCVMAFDTKTGYPLAWQAFERSLNSDDVMSLLLDVVYNWGRPTQWLIDNGSEFVNEPVQRFLHGLYSQEEHKNRTRIIFSEAYQPYGKGRHERQHRIFKDEFCAFSKSYSPNQKESRKPTRQLSYVKPTQTLAEWCEKFNNYLHSYYMDAQRASWLNPDYRPNAPENANRPKTLREAFEIAYKTYQPIKPEAQQLAYLYAKKFRAKLKQGVFTSPVSISPKKIVYVPEGDGIPYERYNEIFEVIVNPLDLSQAWITDLNSNFICTATDMRYKGTIYQPNRNIAKEYRKLRNKSTKEAKELAEVKAKLAKLEEIFKPESRDEKPRGPEIEKSLFDELPKEYFDDEIIAYANTLYLGNNNNKEETDVKHHKG